MTTIYHDRMPTWMRCAASASPSSATATRAAPQARNLRDSGSTVIVGNIDDAYARRGAAADGFAVVPIAEARRGADALFLLTPDEVMPEVYERDVAPRARDPASCSTSRTATTSASTSSCRRRSIDVVMIAPRMIGAGVRDSYVSGEGFPSFVGVHQDATGQAKAAHAGAGQGRRLDARRLPGDEPARRGHARPVHRAGLRARLRPRA